MKNATYLLFLEDVVILVHGTVKYPVDQLTKLHPSLQKSLC